MSIPEGTAGDSLLRSMPIGTRDEAAAFCATYREWLAANKRYGCTVRPANDRPASVRAPDIFAKADTAAEIAGLRFWQMPYADAARRQEFYGLPRGRWERERVARGLPV